MVLKKRENEGAEGEANLSVVLSFLGPGELINGQHEGTLFLGEILNS